MGVVGLGDYVPIDMLVSHIKILETYKEQWADPNISGWWFETCVFHILTNIFDPKCSQIFKILIHIFGGLNQFSK